MYFGKDTILYYNHQYLLAAEANTNLYSQSLHYGYAVFEGIRAYEVNGNPKIFKAKEHFERLIYSAKSAQIPFNYTVEEMIDITYKVLEKNNFNNAYIRPLIFCSPNMGLTKGKESYLTIQAWEWTNGYLANDINIMTSSFERPNPKAFNVEAKIAGHYVNSIMASQDAKDKGFDEAMLLDSSGNVAEASGANIFFEKDGVFYTPPKGNILPGITRATVFQLANELGITVIEKFFTPKEMQGTDAAFFCGTAAEIVNIMTLDKIPFTKKWEDTNAYKIQNAYKALVVEKNYVTAELIA